MCTLELRGHVFVVTFTSSGEHRLHSIQFALHRVTTAGGKLFSNDFDLRWAVDSDDRENVMGLKLQQIVVDHFLLPMPTVVVVIGHASGAGFLLALNHDYVMMRKDRGFLYMSKLDIGPMIPDYFMVVERVKIPTIGVRREVVLRAEKLTAMRAAKMGLVDA